MKKKLLSVMFCGCLLLVIAGCGRSSTKTVNPFDSLSKFKQKIDCDEINDIVDIRSELSSFITEDGKVYVLSFNKPFSNNKN